MSLALHFDMQQNAQGLQAVRERAERGIPDSTERTQVSLFILRGFFILWANAFKGHLLYGVRDLQNLLWIRL